MTRIYNISPGFLQICESYLGRKDVTIEEVFKRLSYEIGGDGKSITKKQMDDYINKADKGLIKVDKLRLNALKQIQKNWDNISQDGEKITFEDMKGHESLLMATVVGTFTETEVDNNDNKKVKISMSEAILEYLKEKLDLLDENEVTKTNLEAYLKEVMSDSPENDDFNTEIIDTLTNMIASYQQNTTIEEEV